jgi:phage-related baseplate assembly protein
MSDLYNQLDRPDQDKEIRYLNKDFTSFKQQLEEFAKVYFPNTFNDFSESSPGQIFIEMSSYVGDVLSFYLDTQLKEHFLSTAEESENIFESAYLLGYKPNISTPATATIDLYQLVPSSGSNYDPDFRYAMTIKDSSNFSGNGVDFVLEDNVNFNSSSSFDPTEVRVYEYDGSNNPKYYILKKQGKVKSGTLTTETFTIGAPQKFNSVSFTDPNFIEIVSCVDSDGNNWYEVPYLGQETIFEETPNKVRYDQHLSGFFNETPKLLRLKKVPRRFATRVVDSNGNIELMFGSGISSGADETIIPNPDNIGSGLINGLSRLNYAFDPSNFLLTRTYGQVPSNTTLTVTYLTGGGIESNIPANNIEEISLLNYEFDEPEVLDNGIRDFIVNSLAVTNPSPSTGGSSGDSIEAIRQNSIANFASQQRTVTKEDYLVRALSMPSRFGSVSKAYIVQDQQITPTSQETINNPLALNLYTLGLDINSNFINLNEATKENLKTYLDQYRLMTDAINIKDSYIINFGVNFEISVGNNQNSNEVITNCINVLKDYFNNENQQINQPIIKSEVYNRLYKVKGVLNVIKLEFINKTGEDNGYSNYRYDMNSSTRDGIIYPSLDPMIFEIKFPNQDIKGKVTTKA